MRKAVKYINSKIIEENLKYISENSTNNKKIKEILLREQKNFCAYTDEYLSITDPGEIDHFNPKLKNTSEDNYNNWFVVKQQWNKQKSNKWENYQPVLHPTADDFEERIIYIDGDYFAKSDLDVEAVNLIRLLRLDHLELADKRKRYIKRKREDMIAYEQDATTFFQTLINCDSCEVSYLRAIKEEFGVDIWQILN